MSGGWTISRLRRDIVLQQLRQRQIRLALAILFLPEGWEMTKTETRRARVADGGSNG